MSFVNTSLGKTVLAGAAGALALATTTTAEARGWHRGGDDAAVAVGAGILGLAVGAAIASDGPRRSYYNYDYGYYGGPAYYPAYRPYGYYYRAYPRYRGGYYYRDRDWRRDGWRHDGWRDGRRYYRY